MAWDLNHAVYVSSYNSVINPHGMFFQDDGSKMFVVYYNYKQIRYFVLSTPWDITTASYNGLKSYSYEPKGIFFSNDGLKLFTTQQVSLSDARICRRDLTYPWTISSSGPDILSDNLASLDPYPRDIQFNPSGTIAYYLGGNTDKVYQISLSTAWTITSADIAGAISASAGDSAADTMFIGNNGNMIYFGGGSSDTVFQRPLATKYDISTMQPPTGAFSFDNPTCLYISPDGNILFTGETGTDVIKRYSLYHYEPPKFIPQVSIL
jgi:DNA-binding beta-propeller fold protein YncE